ncbi:MAG: flagellar biosynthetic protein FliR [Pseudomonadota bacterium]
MSPDDPAAFVLAIAVLFARIGGVFLIAPGLSSMRAPVQVRLFLALTVTLALAPILVGDIAIEIAPLTPAALTAVLAVETATGLMIGLLSRVLFMALQTLAVAVANAIGLAGIPGVQFDTDEPAQVAANIFTATALTILFVSDLHYEILRAVVGSYDVLAAGAVLNTQDALIAVSDKFGEAFIVALRLAAPFLIYAVIINFAVGLTTKLTPNLPVFFVALPVITAGGLIVMALVIREMMFAFRDALAVLLVNL